MANRARRREKALTAVELIAATALASLLMMALLAISASIARSDALMRERTSKHRPAQAMLDLLRHDLQHARTITADKTKQDATTGGSTATGKAQSLLTLKGRCGLDRETMSPTHRPATIRYLKRQKTEQTWLYRRQITRDAAGNTASWATPIASGVTHLSAALEKPGPNSGDASPQPNPRSNREAATGRAVTVTLKRQRRETPVTRTFWIP